MPIGALYVALLYIINIMIIRINYLSPYGQMAALSHMTISNANFEKALFFGTLIRIELMFV